MFALQGFIPRAVMTRAVRIFLSLSVSGLWGKFFNIEEPVLKKMFFRDLKHCGIVFCAPSLKFGKREIEISIAFLSMQLCGKNSCRADVHCSI